MQNYSTSAAPQSLPGTSAPPEMDSSLGSGRILIVDDEQGIRCLLSDGLEPAGFDCSDASGGAEALNLLETQPFDAVISDLLMAGTWAWSSSKAFVRTIREWPS